jgi:hypothetical protein
MLFCILLWKAETSCFLRQALVPLERECAFINSLDICERIFSHIFLILKRFYQANCWLEVDWNGRCETPVGEEGQARPHRCASAEEAHRPPYGKRASWSGKQLISLLNSNQTSWKQPWKARAVGCWLDRKKSEIALTNYYWVTRPAYK